MAKKIWIITLFPDYFRPLMELGVVSKVFQEKIDLRLVQLRDFSFDNYQSVDDAPFGGGPGMILRPDVLQNALVNGVIIPGNYGEDYKNKLQVVCCDPRGKTWGQKLAKEFVDNYFNRDEKKDLLFICGRYEGIDQRFIDRYVDQLISVGDYVLSGGEIAVMAILDSTLRLLKGTLGNDQSIHDESFENDLLEYSQYTRPQEFEGVKVPEILLSGHHAKIKEHQKKESQRATQEKRPDLYKIFRNNEGGS
ncbi:MAG: tRNA (guanosine(37)-N1)-methyltransferase TrmD [Pseudomonadota bacterium]